MRHVFVLGLALVVSLFAVAAKPASAAPSIALVESAPHFMDRVHFTYEYPDHLKDCAGAKWWNCAYTKVECFQGSTLVWWGARPSYFIDDGFLLGAPEGNLGWAGGATDCTARLYKYDRNAFDAQEVVFATVAFHVEA